MRDTNEQIAIERIDPGQDKELLAHIANEVSAILTENEQFQYIAHQNWTAFGQRKDALVATNNRLIIYQRHWFGQLTFHDFLWEDVKNVTIREGFIAAHISCELTDGWTHFAGGLVKTQARALYAICQQKEQEWRERRRVRKMEEERARAGGTQITVPGSQMTAPSSEAPNEGGSSLDKLTQAKQMFDQELISESEYETLKANILSKM